MEKRDELNQDRIKHFLKENKEAKYLFEKMTEINGQLIELLKFFYAETPLSKAINTKTKPKYEKLIKLIGKKLEKTQQFLMEINEKYIMRNMRNNPFDHVF